MAFLAACIAAYAVALARGLAGDRRIQLYGPLALVRIPAFQSFIRRLARFRVPHLTLLAAGTWAAAMVASVGMLVAGAIASLSLTPEQARPEYMIAIPGLNPLIPITYGVMALAVAVVLHELAHGVALVSSGIRIRSAGIAMLGVPLGAFVEPEGEFDAASDAVKVRVYSSGPFANLAAALLALLLLSQALAGVTPVAQGVGVLSVRPGSPADKAGIRPGDVITAIDGNRTASLSEFLAVIARTRAGEVVRVELADGRVLLVELADRYAFTGVPRDRGRGFLGVEPVDLNELLPSVVPFRAGPVESFWRLLGAIFTFHRVAPYLPHFYTEPLGGWGLAYSLLWVAWMNAVLGLTNVLPAVPLDGGSALFAALRALARRVGGPRSEGLVRSLVLALSVVTLLLLVAPVVIPRVRVLVSP